jgi:DNA-binding NarL/FixJ family response regulator
MRTDKIKWTLSDDNKQLLIEVDVAYIVSLLLGSEDAIVGSGIPKMLVQKRLTVRERTVLMGIAACKSHKEIANELHITERTVKFHASQIYAKFGVCGKEELLFKARKEILQGETDETKNGSYRANGSALGAQRLPQ